MKLKKKDIFEFSFKGELWRDRGKGGWYFITLPKKLSAKIRKFHKGSEEGWGRLKAEVKIKKSFWKTSIWYDSKTSSYLLPVKSEIRKKEQIDSGSVLDVKLVFEKDTWFLNLE